MENKEYKGFSLFTEIEDKALQLRNRAAIMVNMLEDNFFKGKVSGKGASLLIGYVSAIPAKDRKDLMQEFVKQANERGFKIE